MIRLPILLFGSSGFRSMEAFGSGANTFGANAQSARVLLEIPFGIALTTNRMAHRRPPAARFVSARKSLAPAATLALLRTMRNATELEVNRNIVEGYWKELKGRTKMQWGELTRHPSEVRAGKRSVLAGKAQRAFGFTRDLAESQVKRFDVPRQGLPAVSAFEQ